MGIHKTRGYPYQCDTGPQEFVPFLFEPRKSQSIKIFFPAINLLKNRLKGMSCDVKCRNSCKVMKVSVVVFAFPSFIIDDTPRPFGIETEDQHATSDFHFKPICAS